MRYQPAGAPTALILPAARPLDNVIEPVPTVVMSMRTSSDGLGPVPRKQEIVGSTVRDAEAEGDLLWIEVPTHVTYLRASE